MGRAKATPVRKAQPSTTTASSSNTRTPTTTTTTTLVLGRQTLAATPAERRDQLQAAWIREQLVNVDANDDDDDSTEQDKLELNDDSDDEDDILIEIMEQQPAASPQQHSSSLPSSRRQQQIRKRRVIEDDDDDDEQNDNDDEKMAPKKPEAAMATTRKAPQLKKKHHQHSAKSPSAANGERKTVRFANNDIEDEDSKAITARTTRAKSQKRSSRRNSRQVPTFDDDEKKNASESPHAQQQQQQQHRPSVAVRNQKKRARPTRAADNVERNKDEPVAASKHNEVQEDNNNHKDDSVWQLGEITNTTTASKSALDSQSDNKNKSKSQMLTLITLFYNASADQPRWSSSTNGAPESDKNSLYKVYTAAAATATCHNGNKLESVRVQVKSPGETQEEHCKDGDNDSIPTHSATNTKKWPPVLYLTDPAIIHEILPHLLPSLVSSSAAAAPPTTLPRATIQILCSSGCLVVLLTPQPRMAATMGMADTLTDSSKESSPNPTTSTHYTVTIALTRQVIENHCHPRQYPLPRRTTAKKYQVAQAVHALLAACYPTTILHDTSLDLVPRHLNSRTIAIKEAESSSSSSDSARPRKKARQQKLEKEDNDPPPGPITARRVYECTDNQQLQRFFSSNTEACTALLSCTSNIPHLAPTLRGYQQAAVAWMLQREQAGILSQQQKKQDIGMEWQLAWYVLDGTSVIPLTEMDTKHNKNNNSTGNTKGILYFCPFAGWLAESLQAAQGMMFGVDADMQQQAGIKGGILAESMGLGKTVEVLALILAHRRPAQAPTARRILNFANDNTDATETSADAYEAVNDKEERSDQTDGPDRVGIVGDVSEIGDEESSDEDDGSLVGGENDSVETAKEIALSNSPASPAQSVQSPVPVSPDKAEIESAIVRWVEDDSPLGSCLCGNLICLKDLSKNVIFCPTCEEPMHLECAAFSNYAQMATASLPVEYRRMFSDDKWECRVAKNDSCCPCCVSDTKRTFESRATLIVTPPAILGQWEREIRRHVKSETFSVAVYDGVQKTCKFYGPRKDNVGAKMKGLHPAKLADNDIVLMSYDVLMGDLVHSDKNKFVAGESNGNLRTRKRYRVVPSPLPMIQWWRICLDEAQRVERPTAASAQMALKLEAEHRWSVTGTPVGRGKLEDLYGLLLFLRMDPFSFRPFFNCCLSPKYRDVDSRISRLLRDVFWRSTKKNELVREQIGIPEQIEKKVLLRFSSIEKHFYDRQLEQTLMTAGDVADRAKSGKKRKNKQLTLLAERLHSLRAACCHPQVGSSGVGKSKRGHNGRKQDDDNLASRVMTMDEILIRFIEDAKLKCEEAQRLVVLNTNAMAAVSKLKVEARARGATFAESDEELLIRSCKLYLEALELAESNAKPCMVLGSAVVSGSTGFLCSRTKVDGGQTNLEWKLSSVTPNQVWARVDFEGPSRRLSHIKLRPNLEVPETVTSETSDEIKWVALLPKTCVFQVSSAAVGGEFVDVVQLALSVEQGHLDPSTWLASEEFRTHKSKSWRVVIRDFHNFMERSENVRYYVGLGIQFLEPDIAFDPLQRLHCLHNAGLAFSSLLQNRSSESGWSQVASATWSFSKSEMEAKMEKMKMGVVNIESLYMDVVRSLHKECARRLKDLASTRSDMEKELRQLEHHGLADCWDDCWWDDFLSVAHLYGNENHQHQLFERVTEDLDMLQGGNERGLVKFPAFRDIHGLRVALQSRIEGIRNGLGKTTSWIGTVDEATTTYQFREDRFKYPHGGFAKCMDAICSLSPYPSDQDVYANSHCRVCKADWNQQGPKCQHCDIGDTLNELEPDRVTLLLLNTLYNVLKGPIGRALLSRVNGTETIEARASKFFEILEAHKREKVQMWRMWRVHLDLMNDIDELNQCKASMRLVGESEDISQLTDEQLNAVVIPCDLSPRYHEHAAKQAMAHGDLRRAKDTLRFLRNQTAHEKTNDLKQDEHETEGCMVCLCPFQEGNRAVLRCGHSFHQTPCVEKLVRGSGGGREVQCPCRCRIRTRIDEVMIASNQRKDDGSRSPREIKGSWGTKVSRLVTDILDLKDTGEKGVVFSQWEDMLDIVQEALTVNGVKCVRAQSLSKIGQAIDAFRVPDSVVLLLNVKNGAEGLTLLEATHVFMVEPLLNHGLDIQAINRIHRIGQTSKTFVHRYLIEKSVEVKIDALRIEHQEDILEDALLEAKTSELKAGGIDGGFQNEAELMDLLKIEDT